MNSAARQVRNASHSIALVALGGEHVVSCFELGSDGEPDLDKEVFVRSYSDAEIANRVFAAQSALLSCKASVLDCAIDRVFYCISSLTSCLHREVRNEASILASAMSDLKITALARRNPAREARKANALARAAELIARRTADLDTKIAQEADARALRGQP